MKYRVLMLILFLWKPIFSQDLNNYIQFNGYINWTAIYDSRQTVSAREGHLLLYPKEVLLDEVGNDLNAVDNFNMAVIQTRLSIKLTAPEFLKAKTSGFIESEFMGNSDNDVNGLRIRHAYVNLEWDDFSILAGQYWNPMYIAEVFPYQIGSNGGAPFQPCARNPQLRLTKKINDFKISAALVTQRDFSSLGPNGSSSEYLRNAALPEFHLQVQHKLKNNLFGIGGEYKKIKPLLKTSTNIKTEEKVVSYAGIAYTNFQLENINFKIQGLYGANLSDLTMIGGYAVRSIDSLTMREMYTPLKIYSFWTDISFGKDMEAGLFAGYTRNLGSSDEILNPCYARGNNIKDIFRIAPRIQLTEGKTKFSFEVEYTTAQYGVPDKNGKIIYNISQVSNTRIYTSIYYMF